MRIQFETNKFEYISSYEINNQVLSFEITEDINNSLRVTRGESELICSMLKINMPGINVYPVCYGEQDQLDDIEEQNKLLEDLDLNSKVTNKIITSIPVDILNEEVQQKMQSVRGSNPLIDSLMAINNLKEDNLEEFKRQRDQANSIFEEKINEIENKDDSDLQKPDDAPKS